MQLLFILSFLVLNTFTCIAQHFGYSGGYCLNHFYDLNERSPHSSSEYKSGSGYRFSISLDDIYLDTLLNRFSLNYSKCHGSFSVTEGGQGGSTTIKGDVDQYFLGFTFLPFNLKVSKKLRISLGGEFNYLVKSDIDGSRSSWNFATGHYYSDLKNDSTDIFRKFNFGIIGRIGYDIKLTKQWYLIPEYNLYLGVAGEFNYQGPSVCSLRHYFMLGFVHRFKCNTPQ
jgi:hypothetical protein